MRNRFINKKRFVPWLILFLFLPVMALLNFTRFVTSRLAEGEPPHFKYFFIMETTGVYSILIVLSFAIWVIKKFPITRKNLITHIPLHLLASMVYGVSHTMLMFSIRTFIFFGSLGGALMIMDALFIKFPWNIPISFFRTP